MTLKLAVTTVVILEKTFYSDLNDIWCVGRGRWVMHDGMNYAVWPDPRSRSRALESRKFDHFRRLSPPPFITGAGKWPRILKLGHNTVIPKAYRGRISDFCASFLCHVTLKLAVCMSRLLVPYVANFVIVCQMHLADYLITLVSVRVCVCVRVCLSTDRLSNDYVRNSLPIFTKFCMRLRNVVLSNAIVSGTNQK